LLVSFRAKKGYYVRRIKDSLWSTFGINRIKPYDDSYTKEQIKAWKQQTSVKQVHDDLYNQSDPNDPDSDTYLTLIIKSAFAVKERTNENAIWTQAVLETIFDETHLSTKIETDIVDQWIQVLTRPREEKVKCKICCRRLLYHAKIL